MYAFSSSARAARRASTDLVLCMWCSGHTQIKLGQMDLGNRNEDSCSCASMLLGSDSCWHGLGCILLLSLPLSENVTVESDLAFAPFLVVEVAQDSQQHSKPKEQLVAKPMQGKGRRSTRGRLGVTFGCLLLLG